MRYNEFKEAVNEEFTRCAKYEPTVNISVETCAVYFDIGHKKGYVLECWYENEVEYVFDIKEY